jgi:hypothetical protein
MAKCDGNHFLPLDSHLNQWKSYSLCMWHGVHIMDVDICSTCISQVGVYVNPIKVRVHCEENSWQAQGNLVGITLNPSHWRHFFSSHRGANCLGYHKLENMWKLGGVVGCPSGKNFLTYVTLEIIMFHCGWRPIGTLSIMVGYKLFFLFCCIVLCFGTMLDGDFITYLLFMVSTLMLGLPW